MSDKLAQLDELIESDILEALGESMPELTISKVDENSEIVDEPIEKESKETSLSEDEIALDDTIIDEVSIKSDGEEISNIDDIDILPLEDIESAIQEQKDLDVSSQISSINTNDLASLLSQLLNNKTIEITIKIKD